MTRSLDLLADNDRYQYWKVKYYEKDNWQLGLSDEQIALRTAMWTQLNTRIYQFQEHCMTICCLFHLSWMFLFQHAFNVVFAFKNKRTPHLADPGNLMDFCMMLVNTLYVATAYKGWRYNTFLERSLIDDVTFGERYWENYLASPINDNAVLLTYGLLMWARTFYSLKLVHLTGPTFAITEKLFIEMLTFALYYFSVLFLFAVVGLVLFPDLPQFAALNTALFTLFRATIQDYNADSMKEAKIGAFLGYVYFIAFMIINLILIVNLIVARLAATYKLYNKKKELLMLLNTLYVREVSEADDKYSAVVSAPFPLNLFHFTLGSLVVSLKSPTANIALLNLYYLPIAILCFTVFTVYQVLVLPFCYLKLIGHKFALMVRSPQG